MLGRKFLHLKRFFCTNVKRFNFIENDFEKPNLPFVAMNNTIDAILQKLNNEPENIDLRGSLRMGCALERELKAIENLEHEFPEHISVSSFVPKLDRIT